MRPTHGVNVRVCPDGSIVRWRRCIHCDSLIVFKPTEAVRQVCNITCKRALFYARHRANGMTEYKAKLEATKVGKGVLGK